MTERLLRALECPWVDILGPSDRPAAAPARGLPLRHRARVRARAAAHGVAVEINSQVDRLDLRDTQARLARDRGRHAGHRLGRAQPGGARQPAVGRRRRAARLADRRRCAQHADARRAAAAAPPPPRAPSGDDPSRRAWPLTPAKALAEIRAHLLRQRRRATIQRDFERAIDLLKALPTEEDREKAAVYMEGLAEMRKEWKGRGVPPR